MKIKCSPEDFRVDELYDLENLKTKEAEKNTTHYFILEKNDYTQMRALERVSKAFRVSPKNIHFAGTKDRTGITTQLISINNPNMKSFEANLTYFNNQQDLSLKHLGEFPSRLNLGDNLGNKFTIVVRDVSDEEVEQLKQNSKKIEEGIINYFDSQRFGYAGNSHVVGKYVIQNNLEKAVFEILTSLPKIAQDNHIEFVKSIKENWEKIKEQDIDFLTKLIESAPRFLNSEKKVLSHLKKHKNDFPGSLRTIHKKLRTLYVGAYQSFIFNELAKKFSELEQIELVTSESRFTEEIQTEVEKILERDDLTLEAFNLPSSPELKPISTTRKVKVFPKKFSIIEIEGDEMFEGKKKVTLTFELGSGEYATNVISQLFSKVL